MTRFIKQKFDGATLESLADFICGDKTEKYPEYRSSSYLTRFFANIGINATHDGTTRKWWTLEILKQMNISNLNDLEKVVLRLVDIREYKADKEKLKIATKAMNDVLFMEGMKVEFNGKDPILLTLKESKEPIINTQSGTSESIEQEFLKKDFENTDITKLELDISVESVLSERINESRLCMKSQAPLASIVMAGSTLEGLLLGIASKYPKEFNEAVSSPKDKDGKIKPFQDWTLDNFINVAHEIGFLGLDVKKFSHVLRDFRNYIHPFQQVTSRFSPDEHTAKICLQVLNSAMVDLINVVQSKKV